MKFLIIFFLIFNSLFQNYSYCNEVFPLRNEYKMLKTHYPHQRCYGSYGDHYDETNKNRNLKDIIT